MKYEVIDSHERKLMKYELMEYELMESELTQRKLIKYELIRVYYELNGEKHTSSHRRPNTEGRVFEDPKIL